MSLISQTAIIAGDGAEVVARVATKGRSTSFKPPERDAGSLWVTDPADSQVGFAWTAPAELRVGEAVTAVVDGGTREGRYLGTTKLGVVIDVAGGMVVVPHRELRELVVPPRPGRLTLAGSAKAGEVVVRYRTATLSARLRTLVTARTEGAELGLTAGTSALLSSSHPERRSFEGAMVVVSRMPSERNESTLAAAQASPLYAAKKAQVRLAGSEEDTFSAELPGFEIDGSSDLSVPLGPWKFRAVPVVAVAVSCNRYDPGKVQVGEIEAAALITSDDPRLFPGGEVTVVTDETHVTIVETPELAQGKSMLLKLRPNRRVEVRAEDIKVSEASGPLEAGERLTTVGFRLTFGLAYGRSEGLPHGLTAKRGLTMPLLVSFDQEVSEYPETCTAAAKLLAGSVDNCVVTTADGKRHYVLTSSGDILEAEFTLTLPGGR